MDLDKYSLEEVFQSAIRSEMDAGAVYTAVAKRLDNAYMKDRLMFLAGEEEKHRSGLEKLFRKRFPKRKLTVPKVSPVPLPELVPPGKGVPVSQVLESAMLAEQAAREFYTAFAGMFPPKSGGRRLLEYFSNMELGHYRLLESERELMAREEWFDTEWPMMHAGP